MTVDAFLDAETVPGTLARVRIVATQPIAANDGVGSEDRTPFESGTVMPGYRMRDATGRRFTFARFLGQTTLVTLGEDRAVRDAFLRALARVPNGTLVVLAADSTSRPSVGLSSPPTIVATLDPSIRTTLVANLHLDSADDRHAAVVDLNGRFLGLVSLDDPRALGNALDGAAALRPNPIARLNLRIAALASGPFGERGAVFTSGADAIVTAFVLGVFLFAFAWIGRAIYRGD